MTPRRASANGRSGSMLDSGREDSGWRYEQRVALLARLGTRLGIRPGKPPEGIGHDLLLLGLRLEPETVTTAAKAAAVVSGIAVFAASIAAGLVLHSLFLVAGPFLSAAGSLLAHMLVASYPSKAAGKHTKDVLRGSMAGTNLMIMSLRQEQSLSSAMVFASRSEDAFGGELRRCLWEVIMAKHAGFEDALQRLGDRFARHCRDFKSSMEALVTASCESTHEGQRRALDRANNAMVVGAKRRIEDYALSLSTPSMIMFGLGILLPLMVGSFLPMLSWDLWSSHDGIRELAAPSGPRMTIETVLVMNCLFPAVAMLVALSTSAGHPLAGGSSGPKRKMPWLDLTAVVAASSVGVSASVAILDGLPEAFAVLASAVAPTGLWLTARGGAVAPTGDATSTMEGALFRTGARMAEGKNFEKAFAETSAEAEGASGGVLRMASVWLLASTAFAGRAPSKEPGGRNAFEALEVVRRASSKDEDSAGMLAMDLAIYLKDLSDLDIALRMRLRPIVSMMKVTSYALAPVVLGVTFAIYVSLASLAGVDADPGSAGPFLIVLGVFLAETNAAVMYFVWGIEGRQGTEKLMASVGQCILCSTMAFAATAFVVAG